MISGITMLASFFVGLGVWLLGIRAYLPRHGGTVVTGATWWLSAWADWQQCSEFARARKDVTASTLARIFALTQIAFAGGIVLVLCGK